MTALLVVRLETEYIDRPFDFHSVRPRRDSEPREDMRSITAHLVLVDFQSRECQRGPPIYPAPPSPEPVISCSHSTQLD